MISNSRKCILKYEFKILFNQKYSNVQMLLNSSTFEGLEEGFELKTLGYATVYTERAKSAGIGANQAAWS